ncbi:MAG: toll/interleukin-1 receptor domain-containing protein [Gammaproteobacteria bacterium]|nr:toll/interleukin-1 receptor domain-containing protein [Gammaproteobacteria bacterium]
MSDIFLSYASEDVARSNELARALSCYGWSVWWDRSILPGKVFDTVIEAELSAAKCVIVLWSVHSVESRWVRAEAGDALDKGRLIPALLDDAVIPLVFRQVQAASLSGWDGDPAHLGFQRLVSAISAVVPPQPASATSQTAGVTAQSAGEAKPQADMMTPSTGWWAFIALCVLVIAGGAFYFLRDDTATGTSSVAKEQQADHSPELIAVAPALQTAQPKPAAPASIPAPPKPEPLKPESTKRASPVVKQSAPVLVKPAASAAKPAQSSEALAKAESAQAASKPIAPLTILAVTWAMPNDNGAASTARIKDYSTRLSRMMTTVVDEAMNVPVRFEYAYPDQQEYYRLLKDKDGNASSKALCAGKRADLLLYGFVKGALFVSASYGYALTRDPVFSVYDCKANKKITQTYQVADHVGDSFPFEKSTTTAFRSFVTQEAALAKR